jgi:hypothetical protein
VSKDNRAIEGASGSNGGASYEAPVLTPLGNLNDLLAGDGGTQCDNAVLGGTATGGHDNGQSPNC